MPATSLADIVEPVDVPQLMPTPTTVLPARYDPGTGASSTPPKVETGIFDTITESIFGPADSNSWRPLPLSTLFSEGWNEAWVRPPSGSGGAPRQGWINAPVDNLYRSWFFTFAYGANDPPKGNAYLGSYAILTPLNRRFMLLANIPFALRNNAVSGLPTINASGLTSTTSQSHSGFGDISFTPYVLLHETRNVSVISGLTVLIPTGHGAIAGKSSLTPAVAVWNNFAGGWVIRGGLGDLISLEGGKSTLISQLAIGQTLTKHDVPLFGDLTYYLSAVVNTPLSNGDHTSMTLTPGMRTHLGHNWYFLAGLPTPVTRQRVAELGMVLWFVKAW
jgi:hypothetical protein